MKTKRLSKTISLLSLLLVFPLLLTACSSSEDTPSTQILVANSLIFPEKFESFTEQMMTNHPNWQEEGASVGFSSINFGNPETDPSAGANIAKVSTMAAAKEFDIMICDTDNAARFARTEMFTPVEEILSEDELEKYQDRLLTFDMVNEDGKPTGEHTAACGISMTGKEPFDEIYGEQEYGVFLVSNAEPMDDAKKVFMDIIQS